MTVDRHIEAALSFLEDVETASQAAVHEKNIYGAVRIAEESLQGDWALAMKQLDAAEASGLDVREIRAIAYFREGWMCMCVSGGPDWKLNLRWLNRGIEAFQRSATLKPTSEAYFNLGRCLIGLRKYGGPDRQADAIAAFREAERMGDVDATKEIARLQAVPSTSSGCYIATACYGNCDHPDVLVFRQFRDERLLPSHMGRMAVALYYAASPRVAATVARVPWVTGAVRRVILEPLARRLRWGRWSQPGTKRRRTGWHEHSRIRWQKGSDVSPREISLLRRWHCAMR